jgi:hypothetical protein
MRGTFAWAPDWPINLRKVLFRDPFLNRSQHLLVFNYRETLEEHAPFSLYFTLPSAPIDCVARNRQYRAGGGAVRGT